MKVWFLQHFPKEAAKGYIFLPKFTSETMNKLLATPVYALVKIKSTSQKAC